MKIRCLLVDDEPIAIDIIRNHILKLENLEISGICANAIEAFEILRKKPIDLVFLDIEMPQITGLDFLKSLKNPPKVIVVSAYRDYAIEGFELDVLDYLLKPVSFERFLKAMNKFYSQVVGERHLQPESSPGKENIIWVRSDRKNQKVHVEEIRYIEGLKDYVKIYLHDKMIISKATIKEMAEKLPSDQFVRIHRSYLVSIQKIRAFTHEQVEVDRNILPIGTSFRASVMHILNQGQY